MIIDADCHISSQKLDGLDITADELLTIMDKAEVDKALIWLKPPYNKDIEPENRNVYQAAQKHPDRFLPFGWANPRLGREQTLKTITKCFEDYGFLGIKFNGAQDGYVIDDESTLPFIEKAAEYGKPIAFHIGADFYENTHPYRLGHIAGMFPDTQFIMIHMGGAGTPSLHRSAIETAKKHPNITLIASAIGEQPVISAVKQLGAERVCFGSDAPFKLMHVQLAMHRALLRDFSAEEQENVLGGSIATLLNVQV